MDHLLELPYARLAAGFLTLAGAFVAVRGVRFLSRGLRHMDDPAASFWLVRGLLGSVVGVALWALAGGVAFSQRWLLVFGLVFLAEELYETGVLSLVLRHGERAGRSPVITS